MKIWSLACESECLYAVVYAETLELAIEKAKKETGSTSEWIGQEFTENDYNGIITFS